MTGIWWPRLPIERFNEDWRHILRADFASDPPIVGTGECEFEAHSTTAIVYL